MDEGLIKQYEKIIRPEHLTVKETSQLDGSAFYHSLVWHDGQSLIYGSPISMAWHFPALKKKEKNGAIYKSVAWPYLEKLLLARDADFMLCQLADEASGFPWACYKGKTLTEYLLSREKLKSSFSTSVSTGGLASSNTAGGKRRVRNPIETKPGTRRGRCPFCAEGKNIPSCMPPVYSPEVSDFFDVDGPAISLQALLRIPHREMYRRNQQIRNSLEKLLHAYNGLLLGRNK